MKCSREKVRAKLMAEAEMIVDELLEWNEKVEEPNLGQMEDIVLKLRKRLSERAAGAEAILENQDAAQPVKALGTGCGE